MHVGMLQAYVWSFAIDGEVGMDGVEPSNPSLCCIPRSVGGRLVSIACGGAGKGRLCRPRAGREQLHEMAAGPLFPAWRDFWSRKQLSPSW